ncbi:unnamed protein product, partial [Rotaria sp. Silwood2]
MIVFRNNSLTNCSQYTDDYEVLVSFPFHVALNPLSQIFKNTNGLMDANEHIYYLNIINQKYVPLTVYCLKYLQKLYIRKTSIYDTRITHLPEQISKLKHLQSLELVNTNLIALPNGIGNLSSLTLLYLPNNKLTSLPKTIKNIRLLSQIVLKNNPYLRSIQSINGLSNLRVLQTDNCPIE